MKHFCYIIAALLLAACSIDPPTATVRINVGGVRSGAITKSVDEALSATAPTGTITLELQSTTTSIRRYTTTAGSEITVPIDEYRVTGTYAPTAIADAYYCNAYTQPKYTVDGTIRVTEGTESYTVDASYDCFALLIDLTDAEGLKHRNGDEWRDTDYLTTVGNYGVAYIDFASNWSASNPYRLRVVAADKEHHEDAEYRLAHSATSTIIAVERGKWYLLGSNEVTSQSGSIGINLPEWTQGL